MRTLLFDDTEPHRHAVRTEWKARKVFAPQQRDTDSDEDRTARRCGSASLLEKRFRAQTTSLHFSPGGEAKWMRGPSVRGTRGLARGGVLGQDGEHGEQA